MQEYQNHHHWTNIFQEENHSVEMGSAQSAPVAQFVAHYLMLDIPAHEKTGEEPTDSEANIGSEPIEKIEKRHAKHLKPFATAKRKRAECSHNDTAYRHDGCGTLATHP